MRLPTLTPLALLLAASAAAAQRHPVSAADLALLHGITTPQLSPDGNLVAYVRTTSDYEANRVSSDIVVVSTDNGAVKSTFTGSGPRWSPDGRSILFSAMRDGKSGLWIHDVAGNTDRFLVTVQVTDAWVGNATVKNAEWSPDGSMVAFVGADGPPPTPATDVKVYSRIMYKTRTGFTDNRRTHIYVVPSAGGEPRLLTPGGNDEHSLGWSPDGKRIAFVSDRSPDPDNTYANDLWTVDVGSGTLVQVTKTPSAEFLPYFSPDGATLAYTAWTRPHNTKDSPAEDTQVWLVPASGCAAAGTCSATNVSRSLDRRVANVAWAADGKSVYFTAGDRGAVGVYRASTTGTVTPVVRCECTAAAYSLDAKNARIVWTQTDGTHPAEVFAGDLAPITASRGVVQAGGGMVARARQLSRDQDAFLARVELQGAQMFWFDSWDGAPVQGWIMKPAGFRDGEKYPAILNIHGGPHGMYGYTFTDRFQTLTARGYGVVFINPRGSNGYGQHFSDGSINNWGGGDYHDLMAGLDYAIAHNAWIDTTRLGVMGGSYGGFMTNWVITQTPRFKAAVAIASVSNLISFYGTSLYTDLIEAEFNGMDGMPWNNWGQLWQWSPLAHVDHVATPTLFIHGEVDHDVPIPQAEEMYTALRKRGVAATFARYPNEGHGLRQPAHIADMNRRVDDWFEWYLKAR